MDKNKDVIAERFIELFGYSYTNSIEARLTDEQKQLFKNKIRETFEKRKNEKEL